MSTHVHLCVVEVVSVSLLVRVLVGIRVGVCFCVVACVVSWLVEGGIVCVVSVRNLGSVYIVVTY